MVSSTVLTCLGVYSPSAFITSLEVNKENYSNSMANCKCFLLVFLVPILAIFSPFSTEQLERGHLKTCHSPAYNLSKAFHCTLENTRKALHDLALPPLQHAPPPPTASYLLCLSHRGLQWVLGTPRNPWAYPTAPPSWKALGTSHLAHRDLNVTPERPHLFDCQLLPTSFLLSMSHNLQLHIYLLIIGLSTDCNLCKGREYIPMYT